MVETVAFRLRSRVKVGDVLATVPSVQPSDRCIDPATTRMRHGVVLAAA